MASGPPPGIPERRKRHEKRHLAFGVTATVGPMEARVTNVSAGGMGIESKEPLKVGKVVSVTVRTRDSSVDVTGVVRWCRMEMSKHPSGETTTIYGAGLKLELPVDRLQRLEEVTKLPLTATEEAAEEGPAPEPKSGFEIGRRGP